MLGRASVAAGAWQVQVDVSDLENLTATFTDANGNTSPFAVFGRAPQPSGAPGDTDGDGVSDVLETLAGTDLNDPASAPVQQGALSVDKAAIVLSVTQPTKDSITATLRLSLPTGFTPDSSTVGVVFGDDSEKVTLDAKGKGLAGGVGVKFTVSSAGSGALIQYTLKNKNIGAALAPYGLTDKTTSKTGESATIPVAVVLIKNGSEYLYVGQAVVTYVATLGKSGKAIRSVRSAAAQAKALNARM